MSSTLAEIKRRIPVAWNAGIACMIWGPPGVGKSDIIREIARGIKYSIPANDRIAGVSPRLSEIYNKSFRGAPVKDLRLSMCTPTNLMGVPVFDIDDHVAKWAMSDLLPMDPRTLEESEDELYNLYTLADLGDSRVMSKIGRLERRIAKGLHEQFAVLFMDEITQANQSIQAAAFQIVLDRKSGTYMLPKAVPVVAAGNRKHDRAGVNAMSTPLLSRFQHFTIDTPSLSEFEEYMIEHKFKSQIMGFLKFRQQALFDFDPSKLVGNAETSDITFACPRTWEFIDKTLKSIDQMKVEDPDFVFEDYDFDEMGKGLIGSGTMSEFSAYLRLYEKLPNPMDVLEGRLTAKDIVKFYKGSDGHEDLSLEYAYIMSMIAIVTSTEDDAAFVSMAGHLNNYVTYDKMKIEWAVITMRSVVKGVGDNYSKLKLWKGADKSKDLMEMANHESVISGLRS